MIISKYNQKEDSRTVVPLGKLSGISPLRSKNSKNNFVIVDWGDVRLELVDQSCLHAPLTNKHSTHSCLYHYIESGG